MWLLPFIAAVRGRPDWAIKGQSPFPVNDFAEHSCGDVMTRRPVPDRLLDGPDTRQGLTVVLGQRLSSDKDEIRSKGLEQNTADRQRGDVSGPRIAGSRYWCRLQQRGPGINRECALRVEGTKPDS
jgi:hypothetical protein